MDINIIVLNYNGIELLKKYIPSVVHAAERCSHNAVVTILDNGSTDGSLKYIKKNFPSVVTAVTPSNLVLVSYNEYLKAVKEKIVLLLNSDIKLKADCIDYLVSHFSDESVFFVAPKVMDIEGKNITGGCMDFSFRGGFFRNVLINEEKQRYSLFIGSSAAYDKNKFLALGGYDPIYLPGTYEDIDICYRAWQHGWVGIYEARAVVYHQDSASFGKEYGNRRRQKISARNAYIFVWKNVRSVNILFQNIATFPLRIIFNLIRLRFDLVAGSLQAVALLPKVLRKRMQLTKEIFKTESEIKDFLRHQN